MEKNPELFISSRFVDDDCNSVIGLFRKLKIQTTITPTKSVVKNQYGDYVSENGCNIIITRGKHDDIKKAWTPLQNNYHLDCAYLKYKSYNGCILGYFKNKKRMEVFDQLMESQVR